MDTSNLDEYSLKELNDLMFKQKINKQQQNEQVKMNMTQLMTGYLRTIYKTCTPLCLKDFKKSGLQDNEKTCLFQCFDRNMETLNMTMENFTKFQKVHNEEKSKLSF